MRWLQLLSFVANRLFEQLFFFEFDFLIFLEAVSVQKEEVKFFNIKLEFLWLFLNFPMTSEMNIWLFSIAKLCKSSTGNPSVNRNASAIINFTWAWFHQSLWLDMAVHCLRRFLNKDQILRHFSFYFASHLYNFWLISSLELGHFWIFRFRTFVDIINLYLRNFLPWFCRFLQVLVRFELRSKENWLNKITTAAILKSIFNIWINAVGRCELLPFLFLWLKHQRVLVRTKGRTTVSGCFPCVDQLLLGFRLSQTYYCWLRSLPPICLLWLLESWAVDGGHKIPSSRIINCAMTDRDITRLEGFGVGPNW